MILVAAVLIAGGLWGIGLALHLTPAEKLGEYADTSFWGTLTDKSWYPTVLGVASAILILLGLWFWWLIIDRRRVTKVEAKESADNGRVAVRLDDIASAVSQDLTRYDGIADCKYRSEVDGATHMPILTMCGASAAKQRRISCRRSPRKMWIRDSSSIWIKRASVA